MGQMTIITISLIYIMLIIACTIVGTLYINRSADRSEPIYRAIAVLVAAMLVYTIFDMLLSPVYAALLTDRIYFILVLASDAMFFVIVVSWIQVLLLLSGNPYIIKLKYIVVLTVIYGIAVESLSVYIQYSGRHALIFEKGIIMCNLCFDIAILGISIFLLVYAFNNMREEKHRGFMLCLNIALTAYMIYTAYWDLSSNLTEDKVILKYQDFDPVFIIYILICFTVIWFAAKQPGSTVGFDISKTIGIEKDRSEDWESLSKKYRLSMREIEVCQLACMGTTNPDIAAKLFISEHTVKHHLGNIYKKTGVKGRYELMNLIKTRN